MELYKSLTNNLKKFVTSLKSKSVRDDTGFFIVEGEKLCRELLNSKFKIEFIVLRSTPDSGMIEFCDIFYHKSIPVYLARKQQFDQMCETVSPQGILAVVSQQENEKILKEPFIVLDGISDPGNLGTIIRTADWFGIKQIICSGESVDRFNSKVIRSSMGSLFRVNLIHVKNFVEFINNYYPEYRLYGASLTGTKKINDIFPEKNFGLVFGNEAYGISKQVRQLLTEEFIIPGFGNTESLNVAVSVGITLYHFKSKSY